MRTPTFEQFRNFYSPSRTASMIREQGFRWLYAENHPTFKMIADNYGMRDTGRWVNDLLRHDVEFAGLTDRFNIRHVDQVTERILTDHPDLKATELLHWIYLHEGGAYESFYGTPDGRRILANLNTYCETDRKQYREQYGICPDPEKDRQEEDATFNCCWSNPRLAAAVENAVKSLTWQSKNDDWKAQPWGRALMWLCSQTNAYPTPYPGDWSKEQIQAWIKTHWGLVMRFTPKNTEI